MLAHRTLKHCEDLMNLSCHLIFSYQHIIIIMIILNISMNISMNIMCSFRWTLDVRWLFCLGLVQANVVHRHSFIPWGRRRRIQIEN